ncbi:MAG: hypothetical protein EOO93_20465 [Pedobacter sp.]|nr:MAG: hypothetical protein EOO93_20465 [Pedobacter sp.]
MDKLGGENTSGLIRYRDFSIGLNLIKEQPLFGHGLFESNYLLSKSYVNYIEAQLFSADFLDVSGDLAGGFTNGLLGVFCWYGIPMGLLLYIFLYKNALVNGTPYGRITFFLILILTFVSEPITFTSFFLIFPLSHIIFKDFRITQIKSPISINKYNLNQ